MTRPGARVLLDSVSPHGHRVTTMEVIMHRFVLAEFNTHRAFSRNSASSRAIPARVMLQRVRDDPAVPTYFPSEQRGMQGGVDLDDKHKEWARAAWLEARLAAVSNAERMTALGVHKSVVNRLLEPFLWHTVIVTATEWDNFFTQRCSPLAQPEIRAAAVVMREAYRQSEPADVGFNEWHTPLLQPDDEFEDFNDATARFVSAARCARVSYLTHDGRRSIGEDVRLYDRLVSADPPHWSPLEHVCRPWAGTRPSGDMRHVGNLRGWVQLRHLVEAERKQHAS